MWLGYDEGLMLTLTPRIVRRTLLPASYVVFLIGLLASAWIFGSGAFLQC
jgi:hypothetical protein